MYERVFLCARELLFQRPTKRLYTRSKWILAAGNRISSTKRLYTRVWLNPTVLLKFRSAKRVYTRSECISASRPGIPAQKHYETRGPVGFHKGSVKAQHETRVYALRIGFRAMACHGSQFGARIHAFRGMRFFEQRGVQRNPALYSGLWSTFLVVSQECILERVYTRFVKRCFPAALDPTKHRVI